MNDLSQFLVESILLEADSVDKLVVVYAGRFQPFHKGHYATYSHLVKKFGKNNVYIGTSNKTDNVKSPFNFKEKVMIMNTMFGVPKNQIVQVKNPYVPTEILKKFDKDTTAFVTVVGKKDASRLGGKFFTPYKDDIEYEGYEDKGYVYIAPEGGGGVSGTEVRKGLSTGSDEDKKKFFTKRAYPKFNQKIFDFIVDKLSKLPEEISISKELIEKWLTNGGADLIKEVSNIIGKTEVDDGPNFLFPSYNTFDRVSQKRAEQIGYTVLSQIMSDELTDIDPHPIYPDGPVKAVTPFPAGVAGKTTATNQKDFYGSEAYDKWFKHVTRTASLIGYSLVDFIELEDEREESLVGIEKEKEEVTNMVGESYDKTTNTDTSIKCEKCNHQWEIETNDTQKYLCHNCGFDNQSKEYDLEKLQAWKKSNNINEDIKLPVNVGDTILTGRFKNKKTVVKTIGKDEHGMPTINGKKVVTFRILNENTINEIPMADLVKIDQYADKQLNPVDVVLTDKHFFDRLTDPRNKKPISSAELIGFFKRLGKKKKEFVNFLNLYGQIVAKDNRSKINIPFMKQANKVIAKTVMRKDDFKTSSPEYKFEDINSKNTFNDFADGRGEGAEKISNTAKEKGGDSLLTHHHFNVKLPYYEKAANGNFDLESAKKEFEETHSKINFNMNDIEFQEEMGRLEVLGELIIKHGSLSEYVMFKSNIQSPPDRKGLRDDKIPGGLAGGMGLTDIAKHHNVSVDVLVDEFKKGISVEMEHTSDREIAKEIALDHLFEDPNYYTKLASVEEGLAHGYPDQKWIDDHEKELKRLRKKFDNEKYYEPALGSGITEGQIDSGEPETGYLPDGKKRKLGKKSGRPEYWFDQGGYTQMHFPKADRMRGKGKGKDAESSFRKVTYKTTNVKTSALRDALKPVGSNDWPLIVKEGLIMEGGAYGHMNHPFDTEINLTFGQLKDIVNKALEGNLELAREKTDGQALAVSWRDGRLVAARNKGHLKNKGAGALDINGVAMKFAGRGELEKAYNFAMKDLTQAISKLSDKQREKIFKGGACFMNLEVIYPTSVNVIPYGQAPLVFHGTMEYNDDGIAIGENQEAARILAGMIKQVNQDVQSAYTIQGPPVVQLPKSKNLSATKGKYTSQISKLQSKFKLKDTDGIADYHQAWWTDFVTKKSPSTLDNKTLMGLVKRWAFYDKSFRLDNKNITDAKTLEWAKGIDKNDHAKMAKDNIRPFEDIFLGLGAEVLSFMSSALTVNPDSAVRDMKKRLDQTIKDVKKSGDPKKVSKLKLELERLNSIGGSKKIVPNEGIVFVYGGKTFKLTGTFAPLNQILGLFYE